MFSKRSLRVFFPVLVLGASALVSAAPDADAKDGAKHGPGRRPGIEFIVSKMQKDLGLSADQTAQVRDMFKQDSADFAARRHEMMGGQGPAMQGPIPPEFEDQLRASAVDTAALNAKFEQRVAEMRAMHAAHVARFQKLHALLTPEQRTKLADLLDKRREKMKDRREEWKEKHGKDGAAK